MRAIKQIQKFLSDIFQDMRISIKQILSFTYLICSFFIVFASENIIDDKQGSFHKQYELSIAAIFCDEAPYLQEWIEYHKLIGVEHFYLYNNGSQDHYKKVLEPYIDEGVVDLIQWPYQASNVFEFVQMQIAVYRDALSIAKKSSQWLAIIDIDEFIVPCKQDHLPNLLREYQNYGGVCLIWSFFGTSDVKKIPDHSLLIETLIYHSGPACRGDMQRIWQTGSYKSIVKTDDVKAIFSPHYCLYKNGKSHTMLPYHEIHINHYWTRDEYFLHHVKIPRRKIWGQSPYSVYRWAVKMNKTKKNNPILRFIQPLKKVMKNYKEA